jgi:hypothetical protein
MKRILLGLVMLGGLALASAPANAAIGECGKSYAFQVHGTEPSTSNDAPLAYIVGIGVIKFNAAGSSGPTGCTVASGELIYNDNDFVGFTAAPAPCYLSNSLTGGGIGCFNGASHIASGTLTPSSFGNGARNLSFTATFTWTNGEPASSSIPLSFTLQSNTGNAIDLGNSVPLPGPSLPSGTPPNNPVLVITMQKQSTTVAFPVTGVTPTACGPFGCNSGSQSGYGTAPYLGLSVSMFEGFGAPSSDPFAQPITGSFGSTVSALQIFANGQAGGSASFSSNDNVGNTTGATDVDCDTNIFQNGNFADGTSNDSAFIIHPSLNCADAAAGAGFTLSAVQFGTTATSGYDMVTGLQAEALTSGLLVPPGLMSTAQSLSSVPAGTITNLVVPTTLTAINKTVTGTVKLTNTSPAGCDVTITMPPASATSGSLTCSLSLSPTSPAAVVVEGDTPSTVYGTTSCTCGPGTTTPAVSTSSTLTITSSNCPLVGAPISKTITCKN